MRIVWTSSLPFSDLPEFAPELLVELQKADLVIFKVCDSLSQRRVLADGRWNGNDRVI